MSPAHLPTRPGRHGRHAWAERRRSGAGERRVHLPALDHQCFIPPRPRRTAPGVSAYPQRESASLERGEPARPREHAGEQPGPEAWEHGSLGSAERGPWPPACWPRLSSGGRPAFSTQPSSGPSLSARAFSESASWPRPSSSARPCERRPFRERRSCASVCERRTSSARPPCEGTASAPCSSLPWILLQTTPSGAEKKGAFGTLQRIIEHAPSRKKHAQCAECAARVVVPTSFQRQ